MADKALKPHAEMIAALQKRLNEIPDWHEAILRANPSLDRLQTQQSVDSALLGRAYRALNGHPSQKSFNKLGDKLERFHNHTVLEVSGFELNGLIKALSEVSNG